VSAYSINATSMTAQNVWNYESSPPVYSPICSSIYEVPGGSLLLDYAVAANQTDAELIGLDPNHNVVFQFIYPTTNCNTAWNSRPIGLDDLQINH
ncbi:MAG: aryl-sulfate sulfotransferase, partial [Steroidobacteraceae bacterium]